MMILADDSASSTPPSNVGALPAPPVTGSTIDRQLNPTPASTAPGDNGAAPAANPSPTPTTPAPEVLSAVPPAPATMPAGDQEGRYVIIDGKPVMVDRTGTPTVATTMESMPMATNDTEHFEFNAPMEPTDQHVIRIPLNDLRRGELKYNVVIRPGDYIYVPQPMIGEYYMGGHVLRSGVYSLTARKITLKEAFISAGMLDPVAIPGPDADRPPGQRQGNLRGRGYREDLCRHRVGYLSPPR